MFKLKKIINKHNNAPEIEVQTLTTDITGNWENVYLLRDGELSAYYDKSETRRAYYVVYGNLGEFDSERSLPCVRITPDMLFEAECASDIANPRDGMRFSLNESYERSGFDSIKSAYSDAESDGCIVDASNWSKKRTVLVRFHCFQ